MRRSSSLLAAILSRPLLLSAACNDGRGEGPGGASGAPQKPLVAGLSVSEVAVFQTLKGSLMKDGTAGVSAVPIIAARPGLLRVYVTPQASWVAHEILVRVELSHGTTALPALEHKQTIATAGHQPPTLTLAEAMRPVGIKL